MSLCSGIGLLVGLIPLVWIAPETTTARVMLVIVTIVAFVLLGRALEALGSCGTCPLGIRK